MTTKTPVVAAAAIGVSVSVDLGGGRQMVLQTHFDQALSSEESNALLDRLTDAADRQRAKYDIEVLEADLEKMRKTREDMLADLARLEVTFSATLQEGNHQIDLANERIAEAKKAEQARWTDAGKQGPLVLSQQAKQRISAAEADIRAIVGARNEMDMKRTSEMGNIQVNIKNWDYNIAKAERELAAKLALRETMG